MTDWKKLDGKRVRVRIEGEIQVDPHTGTELIVEQSRNRYVALPPQQCELLGIYDEASGEWKDVP